MALYCDTVYKIRITTTLFWYDNKSHLDFISQQLPSLPGHSSAPVYRHNKDLCFIAVQSLQMTIIIHHTTVQRTLVDIDVHYGCMDAQLPIQ